MSTISEKLEKINNIKQDIKDALTSKGLTPTDNFESYADLIRNI